MFLAITVGRPIIILAISVFSAAIFGTIYLMYEHILPKKAKMPAVFSAMFLIYVSFYYEWWTCFFICSAIVSSILLVKFLKLADMI